MNDDDKPNVVPLRPPQAKKLNPQLEEIRRLLDVHEPAEPPTPDDEVIADEAKFRQRFGVGFSWGLRHRRDLMRLKREYDLSDGEIILFKRTGNLHRTPIGVELSVNGRFTIWGALQFATFTGFTLFSLFVLWPQLNTLSMLALKGWAVIGFTSAIAWAIYALYLLPWRVFRRVAQQRA